MGGGNWPQQAGTSQRLAPDRAWPTIPTPRVSRARRWLGNVAHHHVAVLGSGDNQVVFALAGLRAKVTSVDISDQQIEVARKRAATDLKRYYGEAARIMRPNGLLIVSEYHPLRRVWSDSGNSLELGCNYFDRGLHRFEVGQDALYRKPGELEQFEFHWTVAVYITAILASGCQLLHVGEFDGVVKIGKVRPWQAYQDRCHWSVAVLYRRWLRPVNSTQNPYEACARSRARTNAFGDAFKRTAAAAPNPIKLC